MARQRLCSKPSGVAHRGHARAPVRAAHDLVLVQRVMRLQRMCRTVSPCTKRAALRAPGPSAPPSSHAGSLRTAIKVMFTEAYTLGHMLLWYVCKGLVRTCCLSTRASSTKQTMQNIMSNTVGRRHVRGRRAWSLTVPGMSPLPGSSR